MSDRFFVCAECGQMGQRDAVGFYEPPDGEYHATSKQAGTILKKNKMCYLGCPSCRSPNVFFSNDCVATVSVQSNRDSLVSSYPEGGINVPAHTIPQLVGPKLKLSHEVVSESDALCGGKNVVMVTTSEPDLDDDQAKKVGEMLGSEEGDEVLFEEGARRIEPVASTLASKVGGKALIAQRRRQPTEEEPKKVDESKIDPSKTGTGKLREHVPRRKYKRECKRCGGEFETKHDSVRHCKKCLRGYSA